MKYEEIKTFKQRCEDRPAHPAEIQLHLHEEIAELRHYIEVNLPKPAPTLWGKVRSITPDGRCIGWDGHEVNTAA